MRLFRSGLRKLRTRPVTWITLLLLIGFDALVLFSIVIGSRIAAEPTLSLQMRQYLTFPGAFELTLGRLLGTGTMLAAAFGAAVAGSEWSWGTLKTAIARGESRSRLTLTGYLAVAVYACLGLLAVYFAAVLMTVLAAAATGVDISGIGETSALAELPAVYARACVGISLGAAVGYAVATIARSQMAGIVLAIGLYFAEGIAAIFAPHVFKFFPFTASATVVRSLDTGTAQVGGLELAVLDPSTALLVSIGWLVLFLGLAAVYTERAEIGG